MDIAIERNFFWTKQSSLVHGRVCANYSRKKSENDFSKLTDGHLDSRNPIIQVGGRGSVKKVSQALLPPPSPQPPPVQSPLVFILRSFQVFTRPHYLRAWNRLGHRMSIYILQISTYLFYYLLLSLLSETYRLTDL